MTERKLMFTVHKPKKKPFPKVAEDGQVLTDISPHYVYICANRKCTCCGWPENWVSKVDTHKCPSCGKIMVRAANPKQVSKEDYDD